MDEADWEEEDCEEWEDGADNGASKRKPEEEEESFVYLRNKKTKLEIELLEAERTNMLNREKREAELHKIRMLKEQLKLKILKKMAAETAVSSGNSAELRDIDDIENL